MITNDLDVSVIENDMDDLVDNKKTISGFNGISLPITIPGIKNESSITNLFSPVLDSIMDKAMDMYMNGSFSNIVDKLKTTADVLTKHGIDGTNIFNGEISQRLINTINGSINSIKYNKAKSKLRKVIILASNLKKQAKRIDDPILKEKYKEALSALFSVIKFTKIVYKNRKYVSDKVLNGLNHIVKESLDDRKVEQVII